MNVSAYKSTLKTTHCKLLWFLTIKILSKWKKDWDMDILGIAGGTQFWVGSRESRIKREIYFISIRNDESMLTNHFKTFCSKVNHVFFYYQNLHSKRLCIKINIFHWILIFFHYMSQAFSVGKTIFIHIQPMGKKIHGMFRIRINPYKGLILVSVNISDVNGFFFFITKL